MGHFWNRDSWTSGPPPPFPSNRPLIHTRTGSIHFWDQSTWGSVASEKKNNPWQSWGNSGWGHVPTNGDCGVMNSSFMSIANSIYLFIHSFMENLTVPPPPMESLPG